MRDMNEVLSRWGVWAANENSGLDYSSIAAGFKGLLIPASKARLSCCDDDGLVIDSCIARLKKHKPDEFDLLVLHYFYGVSKRSIAKGMKKDEKLIRIKIKLAEGFIEGCLYMINAKLELD